MTMRSHTPISSYAFITISVLGGVATEMPGMSAESKRVLVLPNIRWLPMSHSDYIGGWSVHLLVLSAAGNSCRSFPSPAWKYITIMRVTVSAARTYYYARVFS